jgi:hypothetical protein
MLFADDFCLVANCGSKSARWYMHTQQGGTLAGDGQAYRKLIRTCDRHAFKPHEPVPASMRELSREEVSELWREHGRFEERCEDAHASGYMVLQTDQSGMSAALRTLWENECGKSNRSPVFVDRRSPDAFWRVEWQPAVRVCQLRTLADDGQKAIQEHAAVLYARLAKDAPWKSGRMDMSDLWFTTPSMQSQDDARAFALRVVGVEETLRDPEMLTVSIVHDQ